MGSNGLEGKGVVRRGKAGRRTAAEADQGWSRHAVTWSGSKGAALSGAAGVGMERQQRRGQVRPGFVGCGLEWQQWLYGDG